MVTVIVFVILILFTIGLYIHYKVNMELVDATKEKTAIEISDRTSERAEEYFNQLVEIVTGEGYDSTVNCYNDLVKLLSKIAKQVLDDTNDTYYSVAKFPIVDKNSRYHLVLTQYVMKSLESFIDVTPLISKNIDNSTITLYLLQMTSLTGVDKAILLDNRTSYDINSIDLPEDSSADLADMESPVELSELFLVYKVNSDKQPLTAFKASMLRHITDVYKAGIKSHKYPVPVYTVIGDTSGNSAIVDSDTNLSKTLSSSDNNLIIYDPEVLDSVFPSIAIFSGNTHKEVSYSEAIQLLKNNFLSQYSIIAFGPPGVGKSYFLMNLIRSAYTDPDIRPALIRKYRGVLMENIPQRFVNLWAKSYYDDHVILIDDMMLNKESLGTSLTDFMKRILNGPENVAKNAMLLVTTNDTEDSIPAPILRGGRTTRVHINPLNAGQFTKAVKALAKYRSVDTIALNQLLEKNSVFTAADVFSVCWAAKSQTDTNFSDIDLSDGQESDSDFQLTI